MASVKILRALWHRRVLVGLVVVLSVAAGWALAFKPTSFPPESRAYHVGVATASLLVDTPKSQVVEVAPEGSEMLGSRANVLANLMVDGEVKDGIAARVGVPSRKLLATALTADGSAVPPKLKADSWAFTATVVTTSDMSELPIIRIETQAPTVAQSITLANAVVTGLTDYLNSKASTETVSDRRRLRVTGLGAPQAHLAARGPGLMMGAAAALFLLFTGCVAILAISAVARGWQESVAAEAEADADAELLEEEPLVPAAPLDGVAAHEEPHPADDLWPSRLRA